MGIGTKLVKHQKDSNSFWSIMLNGFKKTYNVW